MTVRALWMTFGVLFVVALVLVVSLSLPQLASAPQKVEEPSTEEPEQETPKNEEPEDEEAASEKQPKNEVPKNAGDPGRSTYHEQPTYGGLKY